MKHRGAGRNGEAGSIAAGMLVPENEAENPENGISTQIYVYAGAGE